MRLRLHQADFDIDLCSPQSSQTLAICVRMRVFNRYDNACDAAVDEQIYAWRPTVRSPRTGFQGNVRRRASRPISGSRKSALFRMRTAAICGRTFTHDNSIPDDDTSNRRIVAGSSGLRRGQLNRPSHVS